MLERRALNFRLVLFMAGKLRIRRLPPVMVSLLISTSWSYCAVDGGLSSGRVRCELIVAMKKSEVEYTEPHQAGVDDPSLAPQRHLPRLVPCTWQRVVTQLCLTGVWTVTVACSDK